MSEEIITREINKNFNPADYLTKNPKTRELEMDLDARLAWFFALNPGWRIVLDPNVEAYSMLADDDDEDEEYAEQEDEEESFDEDEYEEDETENPRKHRRKIVNSILFSVVMLDNNGVRVSSVFVDEDPSKPNYAFRAYEKGAYFLLDMNGFSPYYITAEQYALHEKKSEELRKNINETKRIADESKSAFQKKYEKEITQVAESVAADGGQEPGNDINAQKDSDSDDSYKKMLEIFLSAVDEEESKKCIADPKRLKTQFDRICYIAVGLPWEKVESEPAKNQILNKLDEMLRAKKKRGGKDDD